MDSTATVGLLLATAALAACHPQYAPAQGPLVVSPPVVAAPAPPTFQEQLVVSAPVVTAPAPAPFTPVYSPPIVPVPDAGLFTAASPPSAPAPLPLPTLPAPASMVPFAEYGPPPFIASAPPPLVPPQPLTTPLETPQFTSSTNGASYDPLVN